MAEKILVIDDDPTVAELIKLILKPRGLLIYHAINGQEGLKQAYELQPDLIILDIMMPEHDGFEVCARLREFSEVPILMLSAKSQPSDVTHGFAVGADDYVKKPFSNEELVSRIESLLRRNKTNNANTNISSYSDGSLEIELASQKVMLEGKEIDLTPTEFNLLAYLIRHPQKTLSPRTLLANVWGNAYSHDKSLLSLYIHQLRQKLKEEHAEHKYIQTQWGQGYWFNPLSQNQIPVTVAIPEHEEVEELNGQEIEDKITFSNSVTFKWWWLALAILFIFIVLKFDVISSFFAKTNEEGTNLEAIATVDSFMEDQVAGVRGQVCLSNQGKYPTENLTIVDTVQVIGEQKNTLTSTVIDLSNNPIIKPNESYCYPYETFFEPILEPNASYFNIVRITISNYIGLTLGSQHCPGPDPCAFGPTLTTEFSIP